MNKDEKKKILKEIIDVFELDFNEVKEEAENLVENPDIDDLIFAALFLGSALIKEKLIKFFPYLREKIEDYDIAICPSFKEGFDEEFSFKDYVELKNNNKQKAKQIIQSMFNEIEI